MKEPRTHCQRRIHANCIIHEQALQSLNGVNSAGLDHVSDGNSTAFVTPFIIRTVRQDAETFSSRQQSAIT